MSKNIDQVYIANPITTNASTDLMYFGQSPYGVGNDAAMTYANFSAQFPTKSAIQQNSYNYSNDTGVDGTAYIATLSPAVTSLTDGLTIILKPANSNTVINPTLKVNALTAKAIKLPGNNPIALGDITQNQDAIFQYNSLNDWFFLLNADSVMSVAQECIYNNFNYVNDTGVANAYTASNGYYPNLTSLSSLGTALVYLNVAHSNTGASTFNYAGIGVTAIKTMDGNDLSSGMMVAGGISILQANTLNWILLNPFSSLLSSPLTTKGDLWGFSTVNARLPVGTTNGQVLQVNSGAALGLSYSTPTYPSASGTSGKFLISDGTNNVYSTSTIPTSAGATANKVLLSDGTNYVLSTPTFPNASAAAGKIIISDGTNWIASTPTYPNTSGTAGKILRSDGTNNVYSTSTFADTYAVSTLLYASSSNAVSGLATVNSSALSTNASGVPTWLALTDGQVVIGSSTGAPLAATLSAGTGVSITNGHNTITIASNGANPWVDQTGASVTMAVNTGYTSDDGATLVTFTLPATAAIGDWVEINGKGSGGWTLIEGTGQLIHFGNQTTTTTTGSLSSTNQWDCVRLRCVTANTTWTVVSAVGNLTVV